MIEFDLPYPPSINHYYRKVGPRTLISREGRAFRERVCSVLAARGTRPFRGPLALEVEIYPPDRRRRDLDNLLKSLLDAIEKGGAYHDDSQVKRINAAMHEPLDGGKVIVRIEPLESATQES